MGNASITYILIFSVIHTISITVSKQSTLSTTY